MQIKFSAKIEPNEEVTFLLTYEEQLRTVNDGINQYRLNINLNKERIQDFKIFVVINETLPLKFETISAERITDLSNEIGAETLTEAVIVFDEKADEYLAKVEYVPEDADQDVIDEWKFIVNYEVKRPEGGNEVQVGAGRFIHHFSPKEFPQLVKHVIFVIDVSGSMDGRKLKQTSDAMVTILDNLNPEDSFDILRFSDEVYEWEPKNRVGNERLKLDDLMKEAQENILKLQTIGGTNINDAMVDAIKKAKHIKDNPNYKDVKETMIIFLTDGQDSYLGNEEIKKNINRENELSKIPIYGLAFGDGADFDLISQISSQNGAFARRIYESGNSFQQLENFYNEISDPKLKNVKFTYVANGREIPSDSLTFNKIDLAFGKNEYTVIGMCRDLELLDNNQNLKLEVKIAGEGQDDYANDMDFYFEPCGSWPESHSMLCPIRPTMPTPTSTAVEVYQKSAGEEFMEKLWAFKCIKDLIQKYNNKVCDEQDVKETLDDENAEDAKKTTCYDKAVKLAKRYNFITEVTSMVVEANEDYQNQVVGYEKVNQDPYPNPFSYSYHNFGSGGAGTFNYGIPNQYSQWNLQNNQWNLQNNQYVQYQQPQYHNYGSGSYGSSVFFNSATTTTTTTQCASGSMIMYSKTYFRGESLEVAEDAITDLADHDFDDKVQSINIKGCFCWKVYENDNFSGKFILLKPDEYKSAVDIKDIFKKASSVQRTSC